MTPTIAPNSGSFTSSYSASLLVPRTISQISSGTVPTYPALLLYLYVVVACHVLQPHSLSTHAYSHQIH